MRATNHSNPDHRSCPVNCCLPGRRWACRGAGASRAAGLLGAPGPAGPPGPAGAPALVDEATVASLIEQMQEQLDTSYTTAAVPPKYELSRPPTPLVGKSDAPAYTKFLVREAISLYESPSAWRPPSPTTTPRRASTASGTSSSSMRTRLSSLMPPTPTSWASTSPRLSDPTPTPPGPPSPPPPTRTAPGSTTPMPIPPLALWRPSTPGWSSTTASPSAPAGTNAAPASPTPPPTPRPSCGRP